MGNSSVHRTVLFASDHLMFPNQHVRMNNLRVFFLIVAFGFALSGYGQSKIDTVKIKTKILCDHCQTCESCGLQFERDLYLSKGVKYSAFNPSDTTITVVYRTNRTNVEAIRQIISKLGFDADGVPADPKGHARLDDCCRLGLKEDEPE